MKRSLILLLSLLILLTACGETGKTESVTQLWLASDGSTDFSVVVSGESDTASSLGRKILTALRNVTGAEFPFYTDTQRPDPGPDAYEILLGQTDRPESQRAAKTLEKPGDYVICVEGRKLVIVAKEDIALEKAVEIFLTDVLKWKSRTDYTPAAKLSVGSDLQLRGQVQMYHDSISAMTQEQIDTQFGPILEGLFTGDTQQTIIRSDLGRPFSMHFPDIIYRDGKYYAYYICYATHSGKGGVGLAVSENGINWHDRGCVIQPEADYDRNGAYFAGAWLDTDGTVYLTYESKGDANSRYGTRENIALATSTDGENFTKQGVILRRTDAIPWLRVNVGTPDLYKIGDVWYLSFHGYDGKDCQIGMAYGKDLYDLTVVKEPIIPTQDGTLWSGTTGRRDILYADGYYYMVYEISTDQNPDFSSANWTHMFARSRDMLTWEITAGPLITQNSAGFGYDGPCWMIADGHLYVYVRSEYCTMMTELTRKD